MNYEDSQSPKVCIIGDSNVGKTCIINRLIKGIFTQMTDPTIGNSFMKRTFFIDGHSVEISIWDTAELEISSAFAKSHCLRGDFRIIARSFAPNCSLKGDTFAIKNPSKSKKVTRFTGLRMPEFSRY